MRPLRVDQINAVGPAGVGPLGAVAKFIEHAGNLYAQLSHASAGNIRALFFILRTGEYHLIFYIALHLPDVAGMGFRDVHHQKSHAILVLLVEFVEGRNLPPEWRSSVTAENQHDGLLFVQGGKLNPLGFVQLEQSEIGCRDRQLADFPHGRAARLFQTGKAEKEPAPASSP